MPSNLGLLAGAVLVTSVLLLISDATLPTLEYSALTTCTRWQQAHIEQLISDAEALQPVAPGLQPASAAAVGGVAADALRRAGWRSGVQFAKFDATTTLKKVLTDSWGHAGSYLLILPGNGTVTRRAQHTPFFSVDPAAATLASVLAPAAAALNAAAGALEKALGRRLFAFRLEAAPLPACASGSGPCAVWEASSGRVVLDAGLASKIAAAAGLGAAGAAAGDAAGSAEAGIKEESAADGGLSALLAGFVDRLAEQAQQAAALMQSGKVSLSALAALFAKAGAASVTILMVSQIPLWFCIACPIVLGMLAPFLFNFGLTAAAEALCAQLHLADQTCTDLWWGAFAVALMLSLGAALPIIYICRLPECGRHAAGGAGLVVTRMLTGS